jgi:hypothetical protein
MTEMGSTIIPKSDQLNFDDFAGGKTKTIKITKVVDTGDKQQPRSIYYEGDEGKPWKPCKGMRRVLVNCWGRNENNEYIGRLITLYGDPSVEFGGVKQGGIRISHLSHINEPMTMPLTERRLSRRAFTVLPLNIETQSLENALYDIASAPTLEGMEFKYKAAYRAFADEESRRQLIAAKDKRKSELTPQAAP